MAIAVARCALLLLSLAIAFGLVVGDCYRSLRTVLLSLLVIAVALAHCALRSSSSSRICAGGYSSARDDDDDDVERA
jgi:uncharacterized membrane protein YqjE